MRLVRPSQAAGPLGQVAVLAVLAGTVGLPWVGWVAGLACGVVTDVLLAWGLRRQGAAGLGPADHVTRVRAALAGGVAALVIADVPSVPALVALAAAALVLDGVDGLVARRTGTATELGARFDMEVDAFLILLLSLRVAENLAPWALLIGLARYAFVAAWAVAPWLRRPVPFRFWRKVVAAIQGIALTVAAADVVPGALAEAGLAGALLLLAESFGRDVVWLWRHERRPAPPSRRRTTVRWGSTALGTALIWFALLTPDDLPGLHFGAFLRIPVEALVVGALALVLPTRTRQALAVTVGSVLGVLALLAVLDMAFNETLDRRFNPISDWSSLGPAVGVVRDSVGAGWADVVVALALLLAIAVPVAAGATVLRLTTLAARHRRPTARALAALGVVWAAAAAIGAPLASGNAAQAVYAEGRAVDSALADANQFGAQLSGDDPIAHVPAAQVLSGLRGKDVLLVFVESYGKVAVQDSWFSPPVDATLDRGSAQLRSAGFDSRSAFLTSPTFGGISWLAHSTLQSGTWVDNVNRYAQLTSSSRYTLSDAFHRAGWRTVVDVPSNRGFWAQGQHFYHYDQQYARENVGYHGPAFSYASMPDQYTLAAIRQNELLRPHRRPIFGEIDLVSSHTPWAPLPRPVSWDAVGDGSVFDPQPAADRTPGSVWQSAHDVQDYYGQSIRYSLSTLVSYVRKFADPNLVMVVLGDHQPAKIVSGEGASHDVPISIISADPAVLDHASAWGWTPGLRPTGSSPVTRMDTFRDRFLRAFSG